MTNIRLTVKQEIKINAHGTPYSSYVTIADKVEEEEGVPARNSDTVLKTLEVSLATIRNDVSSYTIKNGV
jgi:hypothetical protein